MFYNHKQLSDKTWFAGGIWSWSGTIPHNEFSLHTMIPALNSCHRNKIRDIIFTMGGDDGGECSHFAQLPAMLYLAEYARGNKDEAKIKAKFKRITGMDYDDFMYIDKEELVKQDHELKIGDHVRLIKMNREGDIVEILKNGMITYGYFQLYISL